jgi:hypothetical protein
MGMIKVNGSEEIKAESLNPGTSIELSNGTEFKLYTKEELAALLVVLSKISEQNDLE